MLLTFTAFVEDSASEGIKLGFGFDRDFGVVAAFGNINAFIGNKGAAVDFIFSKSTLKMDARRIGMSVPAVMAVSVRACQSVRK